MAEERKYYRVDALPSYPGEIGRWLWMLEEVRRHTLETVEDIGQAVLDWRGQGGEENSIGSLLYHVAIVEMDWLFFDIRGKASFPEKITALFPLPMRTDQKLTHVPGVARVEAVQRLDESRRVFLDDLSSMSLEDWRRARTPVDAGYHVTPEWVVFHLVEHEARHADQVRFLKVRASRNGLA
jgi:uncharacterized damage-inducible protein DinB